MTHDGGFRCAVPILPSLDVRAAVEFYQHKLGFTLLALLDNGPQDQYAMLRRGAVEIHLWGIADPYLVTASGVAVAGALEASAQKGREFSIYDADGNLIRFGEVLP